MRPSFLRCCGATECSIGVKLRRFKNQLDGITPLCSDIASNNSNGKRKKRSNINFKEALESVYMKDLETWKDNNLTDNIAVKRKNTRRLIGGFYTVCTTYPQGREVSRSFLLCVGEIYFATSATSWFFFLTTKGTKFHEVFLSSSVLIRAICGLFFSTVRPLCYFCDFVVKKNPAGTRSFTIFLSHLNHLFLFIYENPTSHLIFSLKKMKKNLDSEKLCLYLSCF
jgi:hypothetical protein